MLNLNPSPQLNTENSTILMISPVFLPGGGGKEVSEDHVAKEIHRRDLATVEIITYARGNEEDMKYFDDHYGLKIVRIRSRWLKFLTNLAENPKEQNVNRFMGGKRLAGFSEKFRMSLLGGLSFLLLFPSLYSRIKAHKGKFIILDCHSITAVLAAVAFRKLFRKEKVVVSFTNGFVYKRSGYALFDFITEKILKAADACFCISNASTDALISEFHLTHKTVHSYRFWVDAKEAARSKKENLTYKSEVINLLFVGRVIPDKGIKELINLARVIKSRNMENLYKITFIGDSNHEVLQELIDEAESNKCVRYLGRVEKPELWKHYFESDIFLMTSVWVEASGNVTIEAYASGVPVIGHNVGGVPEIISGFKYYKIIDNLEPDTLLSSIDSLSRELRSAGKEQVYKECIKTINEMYSPKNYDLQERVYHHLFSQMA